MKPNKLQIVLVIFGSVVVSLLAIALLFIEIRLLVSGDFALYEWGSIQAVRIFSRIMALLVVWAHAISAVIALKKIYAFQTFAMFLGFAAATVSLLSFAFYEWYIALALTLSNVLVLLSPMISLMRQRIFLRRENED